MSAYLPFDDYQQFLRVHHHMIVFAGVQTKMFHPGFTVEAFRSNIITLEEKLAARNQLYETAGLIDRFLNENPAKLTKDDLEVAQGFHDRLSGSFFIFKHLKQYSIFLQDGYAFGVLGLGGPLHQIIQQPPPVMVKAVLVPFKGQIVIDGLIESHNLSFGGSIKRSMKQTYDLAKAKYGVITSLPVPKAANQLQAPEAELDMYMKNAENRETYEYEIDELLEKHPALLPRYYWHWGKYYARERKKFLKHLGVKKRHFAILRDTIVASGRSKAEVTQAAKEILPKDMQKGVYYFSV